MYSDTNTVVMGSRQVISNINCVFEDRCCVINPLRFLFLFVSTTAQSQPIPKKVSLSLAILWHNLRQNPSGFISYFPFNSQIQAHIFPMSYASHKDVQLTISKMHIIYLSHTPDKQLVVLWHKHFHRVLHDEYQQAVLVMA